MSRSQQDFHSQFSEDRILAKIFRDKQTGTCVEVGANDGVHGSTTLTFERAGWNCVLVEPNPLLCERLRRTRQGMVFACAASSKAGELTLYIVDGAVWAHAMSTVSGAAEDHLRIAELGLTSRPVRVPALPLDDILESAGISPPLDFVSIDVEGFEIEVLRGFTIPRWQPRIVIVEDNSGGRDLASRNHLAASGYTRFRRTGVNDWYASHLDTALVNRRARLRLASQAAHRPARP